MSAKKSAEVLIGGKVYTLSGYEEEEYLQKVAAYINNKPTLANVATSGDYNDLVNTPDMSEYLTSADMSNFVTKTEDESI